MKRFICLVLLSILVQSFTFDVYAQKDQDNYRVIFDTPSINETGNVPIGNGSLG
ncbi:hypothetical protein [Pedobacter gandavensis]|uniref:Uncharacterized protein n=1 Tax=Pedobacter gandavensis TaxID=2679963 RepID=A0ABR6EZ73_9SPHI|nr:hypothetical protein [Pedobacter gandavensis]MBB2150547.1 hypothetical protein [Pedobacter gandavensis]